MAEIDFITALGRLLRDGHLRDAFAANPRNTAAQIGVRATDQPRFLQLQWEDLEFQARVLLRKRFELLRPLLPRTCACLEEAGWPDFLLYGRSTPPVTPHPVLEDAFGLCRYLRASKPSAVCPLERNRTNFAFSSRRFRCHFVWGVSGQRPRLPGLQVFARLGSGRWHEWLVYPGL